MLENQLFTYNILFLKVISFQYQSNEFSIFPVCRFFVHFYCLVSLYFYVGDTFFYFIFIFIIISITRKYVITVSTELGSSIACLNLSCCALCKTKIAKYIFILCTHFVVLYVIYIFFEFLLDFSFVNFYKIINIFVDRFLHFI